MVDTNFLICLVGLPASGKSTFANSLKTALQKRFNKLEVKIIDPDIIRNNLTSNKFDYEKEHLVRKRNLEIIKGELEKGNIVISDDLNYYSSMRHDLKEITDDLNLGFYIIYIATPIEICMKWNEKRGEPIPKEVIVKIQDKFDMFDKYYWDKPIAKYDLSEIVDLNIIIMEFLTRLDKEMNIRDHKIIKKKITNDLSSYNENLDKITRTYIGKLVLNPYFNPLKKKIFQLRKTYIKENKNKALSEAEILKSFKIYLEKTLKIKIS
ncbi:MAG: AAA family ATPase [Candidatus Hodarchaeota archaeon]